MHRPMQTVRKELCLVYVGDNDIGHDSTRSQFDEMMCNIYL